jgi:hypothetical protein
MRLSFLNHLIDAVVALAQPKRLIILGSSSLLPAYPGLGETGQPLELSLEADLLLEPVDESLPDLLKEAVGHESGLRGDLVIRPTFCGRQSSKRWLQGGSRAFPGRGL